MSDKKRLMRSKYSAGAQAYWRRYQHIQEEKYKQLIAKLVFHGKTLLLDLGAGPAVFKKYVKQHTSASSFRYFALDLSRALLQKHSSSVDGELIVGDMEHLPFKSSCSKLTISISSIMNCSSPPLAWSEILRVTASDGSIALSTLEKTMNVGALSSLVGMSEDEIFQCGEEDIAVIIDRKKDKVA
ncbi:MAG: class I SAM-dependent methyltransferase [Candidatus Kariarchaeaceae archaeon]